MQINDSWLLALFGTLQTVILLFVRNISGRISGKVEKDEFNGFASRISSAVNDKVDKTWHLSREELFLARIEGMQREMREQQVTDEKERKQLSKYVQKLDEKITLDVKDIRTALDKNRDTLARIDTNVTMLKKKL